MPRPKGSKNNPGYRKPGPKRGVVPFVPDAYTPDEVSRYKVQILNLFERGEVENLSLAADVVGVPKVRAYGWLKTDTQWKENIRLASEVVADMYEQRLLGMELKKPQVTALIFILNGLRPEKYRDSYKLVAPNPGLESLLSKLAEAGEKKEEPVEEEKVNTVKELEELFGDAKGN